MFHQQTFVRLPLKVCAIVAIILYESDKLSTDALVYIKWLLERYKGCNKVFFCCNDVSNLQPIESLCRVVKLLPPFNEEIVEVLEFIAKQEGIELPRQLAEKISENSNSNLRQAIRSFEATWRFKVCNSKCSYALKEDQVIMTGWEDAIAKVAKDIVQEQSPKQLYTIRRELLKLRDHNVSPLFIFKTLVEELKKHLNETLQIRVDKLYREYNRDDDSDSRITFKPRLPEEMNKGQKGPEEKNILHFMRIEEFTAKFMSCYKCLAANDKLLR